MTRLEEFKIRFPEFVNPPVTEPPTPGADDTTIEYWIADALDYLSSSAWGHCYERAVLLYAAFNLAKSIGARLDGPASGVSGPTSSASVGGESTSYANNARFGQGTTADDRYLMYPPYGPDFMALRDAVIPGGQITSSESPCNGELPT